MTAYHYKRQRYIHKMLLAIKKKSISIVRSRTLMFVFEFLAD